ncbi:DUF4328 domain-containing protein [Streptomyces sp. NRRL WC-3742]|uniref:DUF4328 domain-containing protein n=1 Tax=Streptomyces sp. NRRL WC-3742 TaxID=1463934 RepID=UPI0004CC28D6|nr:DUF4328 domain-containing protein [Streptomyces sp. NRRL WC-3742]
MGELTQRQVRPPSDPREPARGLQVVGVLAALCYAVGRVATLGPGHEKLTGVMGVLVTLFTLIGLLLTAVWVRRAWANAEALAPGVQRFGSGWALAGMLIPGLNLVLRWPIALGLWRAGGVRGGAGLVHAWAGAGVAFTVAHLATTGSHLGAPVCTAVAIGLAHSVLGVLVIERITRRQVEALEFPPAWPDVPAREPVSP